MGQKTRRPLPFSPCFTRRHDSTRHFQFDVNNKGLIGKFCGIPYSQRGQAFDRALGMFDPRANDVGSRFLQSLRFENPCPSGVVARRLCTSLSFVGDQALLSQSRDKWLQLLTHFTRPVHPILCTDSRMLTEDHKYE